MSDDGFPMWTVYYGAKDMPPGVYRVRRCVVTANLITHDSEATDHASLEEARHAIPPGLACLTRHPGDEQQIVEVWF